MKKKPRLRNQPIMSRWMFIRYVITGFYVGFATISAFISYYLELGVTFKQLSSWATCKDNDIFQPAGLPNDISCGIFSSSRSTKGLKGAQSLSLTVLVSLEMLKALSAVSLDQSIFKIPPWKNKWLLCKSKTMGKSLYINVC